MELNRKWLVNLIVSYKNTATDVNRRVTNLYTAQQALAVAILLLVLLAVLGLIASISI
jgi:hypothetical protein